MLERTIRAIAGTFIVLSLILAYYVNTNWYWFTAFVGINLLQSAFTRWCLMEELLKKSLLKQRFERPVQAQVGDGTACDSRSNG